MTFTPNLVVGGVITFLGAALFLDQLGALDARTLLHFWPVLLMIFGASIVFQSLRVGPNDTEGIGRRAIVGPGFVLFLVIVWLLSSNAYERRFVAAGASEDAQIALVGIMGRDNRTSTSTAFRGAQMTSVMGGTRLDLRQAAVAPGEEATVDVFGLMGAVEVIVPETWIVDVQTTAVMGGVRDRRGVAGDTRDDDSWRARRERRQAARENASAVERAGRTDLARGPSAEPQAPASPSGAASAAAESASPSAATLPSSATSSAPATRLVLRGVVLMGGLIIRS